MQLGRLDPDHFARGLFRSTPRSIGLAGGADTHSVLLHELQHAVQRDEGFNVGPSSSDAAALAGARHGIAPFDAYQRSMGESEARAVQSRMGLPDEQRGAVPPWQSHDVPVSDQLGDDSFATGDLDGDGEHAAFDNPFPMKWVKAHSTFPKGTKAARFYTETANGGIGDTYKVHFYPHDEPGDYGVEFFKGDGGFSLTNDAGRDSTRIMGSIANTIRQFAIDNPKAKRVGFSADNAEPSRVRLYRILSKRLAGADNFSELPDTFEGTDGAMHNTTAFIIHNLDRLRTGGAP